MAHAIQLPEVILTRTRDELTSRLAIHISKWHLCITILMQETMNLSDCTLLFTHIQSTSMRIAVKERVET